jgi:hypothetical protein
MSASGDGTKCAIVLVTAALLPAIAAAQASGSEAVWNEFAASLQSGGNTSWSGVRKYS